MHRNGFGIKSEGVAAKKKGLCKRALSPHTGAYIPSGCGMDAKRKQFVIKRPPSLVMKPKGTTAAAPPPVPQTPVVGPIPGESICPHCGMRRLPPLHATPFDYRCTYCGHTNSSAGQAPGTEVVCGGCGNRILVPLPPALPPPQPAPAATEEDSRIKFFCVYCCQKLSASAPMVGHSTLCPNCSRSVTVPAPRPQVPTA
jgi:DNA-directed RNA polymerase subunit RPC12/RpoP